MPLNQETRLHFTGFVILMSMAIVGACVLSLSRVSKGQIDSVLVTIVGFAAVMANQWRIATQVQRAVLTSSAEANAKAEEVRLALEDSRRINEIKAAEAREAIERATRHSARNVQQQVVMVAEEMRAEISEVKATTQATHDLVNGGNAERMIAFASVARKLAERTGEKYDRAVADRAEAALREYEAAQMKQLPGHGETT